MDLFSDLLSRLKHELRTSKDQEVAAALGLGKTAFSERKKRNSFPERELLALAKARPELGIDTHYVLTGITGAAQALLDAKEARIARAADSGMGFDEIRAMERAADPANVDEIVKLLNECRAHERSAVHTLLKSMVDLRAALSAAQVPKRKPAK